MTHPDEPPEDHDRDSNDDFEQKLRYGLEEVNAKYRTIRFVAVSIVTGAICIAAIAAWASVKIYSQASWVDLWVSIFAPGGFAALLISVYLWRLKLREQRPIPKELPWPKEGEDEGP